MADIEERQTRGQGANTHKPDTPEEAATMAIHKSVRSEVAGSEDRDEEMDEVSHTTNNHQADASVEDHSSPAMEEQPSEVLSEKNTTEQEGSSLPAAFQMEEQSDEEFTPSVKGPGMSKRPITQPTTVAGRKAAKHHKRKQVQRFSEEETRALIAWLDEGDNFDAFYHATRRTKSTEELSLHLMRELGTERSGMTLRNKLMDMRAKFLALARDERDKGYSLKTCEEYFPGYADFKSIMERRDNFTQSDLEPAKSSDEYEDDDDDEIVAEKPSFDVSHQSIETVDRPMKKQRRSTGLMPTSGPTPRRQDDYATRERERHEMERERHQLEMRRQQLEIERLEREAEVHELRLENEKARLEKEKSIRTLRDELIATLSDSTDNHVKLGLLNALK